MVFTLYRFTWSGGSRELTRNANQTQPGHGTVNWEFCRDLGAFDGVSTSKTAGPVNAFPMRAKELPVTPDRN
ncbi:hypothetical protein RRG08_045996 [Elysia crispata]|uniref:Uncharacterized protein n=1 Tax=Elysia crispata TaxID=231223 RepID=A0AAE1D872_9GAST|nr:hypothetical protein RRG08_045996 [Elysia crispata]